MNLPINTSDKEILNYIDTWAETLAKEDYIAAFNMTEHDSYYGWTPELMGKVISGYGLPGKTKNGIVYKVTSPLTATGERYHYEVERLNSPGKLLGNIYYDLPLNGEWSDLTATFRLEKAGDYLKVILEEIHVL
ncbi:hypothetical protein ACFL35_17445 [Candidatus Riflebacteria bacterium]